MVEVTNRVVTQFEVQSEAATAKLNKLSAATEKQAQAAKVLATRHSEIRRVMSATGLTANQSARAIGQLGFTFDKSGRAVDALGERMEIARGTMVEMQKTTRRFEMGFLSLMFASMALNRAVGTFLRGAITAYDKASGEQNAFRKETNKLIASWEFFKFSLIDALAQSQVFIFIVDKVTQLINAFNRLTPATKSWIALGAGFIFILTLLTMIIGQIGLAIGGIQSLGDIFKVVFSRSFIPTLGKVALGFLKFLGMIALVIAAFIFLKSLIFGFDQRLDENLAKWQRNGGIITKIILGIVRVLNFAGEFFRVAFANIFDTIILNLQTMLNMVIRGINRLIGAINMIPGVSVPIIPRVNLGAFDRIAARTTALQAQTPSLADFFTGGTAPTNTTNTTTVDNVNINIDGATADASDIANQVIEQLNQNLNTGLDSSNI